MTPKNPSPILHEAKQLYKVGDRLESLAGEHPIVSDALVSLSGTVRSTASLLEVLVATRLAPIVGLGAAEA